MTDLHRFQDIAKDPKRRSEPLPSRQMDENWTVCRTEIEDSLKDLFVRKENFPKADKIALAVKSGNYVIVVQNGKASLIAAPSSGTHFLGVIDGVWQMIDSTSSCP